MSVTIFQYATYFLSVGSSKAIPKAIKQIAQESKRYNRTWTNDKKHGTCTVHVHVCSQGGSRTMLHTCIS